MALSASVAALTLSGCAVWRLPAARDLVDASRAYQQQPALATRHLLVVGDSTAVGTGASEPRWSVVGRIGSARPAWRISNRGVNGARAEDVVHQLQTAASTAATTAATTATGKPFDVVLILVGGNDVMRLSSETSLREQLLQSLALAGTMGREVILMPCGNVGAAPFFFPPLTWLLRQRSAALHRVVQTLQDEHPFHYVKLFVPEAMDPFAQDPGRHFAADGLHPSDAGYAHWHHELMTQAVPAWR